MKFGLVLPHACPAASPSFIRDFAQTAEGCGIERLWAVDHLVLPRHTSSPYVLGRNPTPVADGWLSANLSPNYEMLTTLSWVAGQTTTIGLGTSVAVLPIRHPVANARQLASLDALSGGRLMYGVGIGWLQEEAIALDMPWEARAARSEEHIALLRALWCADDDAEHVEFHGRFYDLDPIDTRPTPEQRPIPILIGGHSRAALARAVRTGDGWIAAPMSHNRFGELLDALRRITEEHDRPMDDLYVVASTTYDSAPSFAKTIAAFRDLGVNHLQITLPTNDPADTLDCIARLEAIGWESQSES